MSFSLRQEYVSQFLRDFGFTINFPARRAFVMVSGQDDDKDNTYTFDCGGCPDEGSVVPGTEDPSDIGASKFDCSCSTHPSVRGFNEMTFKRQCRYPETTSTHKIRTWKYKC